MAEDEPESSSEGESQEAAEAGDPRPHELQRARSAQYELVRALATQKGSTDKVKPIKDLPSMKELERRERDQDLRLKRLYGWVLLAMMGSQIAVADWVFIKYAGSGRDWDVPPEVMVAWLSATVVEVIGVVLVVTRSLFPRKDADTTV